MPKTRATRKKPNPMLLVCIYNALTDRTAGTSEQRIAHAAVHAWYEGHIAGERTRRTPYLAASETLASAFDDDDFPMPPFPPPRVIHEILENTAAHFAGDEHLAAAIAYAAALAWKGGFAEGKKCHGCSYRGRVPKTADEIRGGAPLELLVGGAPAGLDEMSALPRRWASASRAGSSRRRQRKQ